MPAFDSKNAFSLLTISYELLGETVLAALDSVLLFFARREADESEPPATMTDALAHRCCRCPQARISSSTCPLLPAIVLVLTPAHSTTELADLVLSSPTQLAPFAPPICVCGEVDLTSPSLRPLGRSRVRAGARRGGRIGATLSSEQHHLGPSLF